MIKNDGGLAFPFSNNGNQQGMTLRDYFAGQALNGLCANSELMSGLIGAMMKNGEPKEAIYEHVAQTAFANADAMIAERDKE